MRPQNELPNEGRSLSPSVCRTIDVVQSTSVMRHTRPDRHFNLLRTCLTSFKANILLKINDTEITLADVWSGTKSNYTLEIVALCSTYFEIAFVTEIFTIWKVDCTTTIPPPPFPSPSPPIQIKEKLCSVIYL